MLFIFTPCLTILHLAILRFFDHDRLLCGISWQNSSHRLKWEHHGLRSLTVDDPPQLFVQSLFPVRCISNLAHPSSLCHHPVGTTSPYVIFTYCPRHHKALLSYLSLLTSPAVARWVMNFVIRSSSVFPVSPC